MCKPLSSERFVLKRKHQISQGREQCPVATCCVLSLSCVCDRQGAQHPAHSVGFVKSLHCLVNVSGRATEWFNGVMGELGLLAKTGEVRELKVSGLTMVAEASSAWDHGT